MVRIAYGQPSKVGPGTYGNNSSKENLSKTNSFGESTIQSMIPSMDQIQAWKSYQQHQKVLDALLPLFQQEQNRDISLWEHFYEVYDSMHMISLQNSLPQDQTKIMDKLRRWLKTNAQTEDQKNQLQSTDSATFIEFGSSLMDQITAWKFRGENDEVVKAVLPLFENPETRNMESWGLFCELLNSMTNLQSQNDLDDEQAKKIPDLEAWIKNNIPKGEKAPSEVKRTLLQHEVPSDEEEFEYDETLV